MEKIKANYKSKLDEQKKENARKEVAQWITEDRIKSVSKGFRVATQEIFNMIQDSKTLEEIQEYCNLILENKEKIEEVAIKHI